MINEMNRTIKYHLLNPDEPVSNMVKVCSGMDVVTNNLVMLPLNSTNDYKLKEIERIRNSISNEMGVISLTYETTQNIITEILKSLH
jgi:hypothetical protein